MNPIYFLWDYQLSEKQVRDILSGDNDADKRWLMARIISHARYEDIWKYLTLSVLVKEFSHLKLKPEIKSNWIRALKVWGYDKQISG